MIANKINPKLKKAISKYGLDISVFRNYENDFGENIEYEKIFSFKALYSESSTNGADTTVTDKGRTVRANNTSLICLIDEYTSKVTAGTILEIKGQMYEVIKTQNSNLLDSYYEISIEKVVKNEF
jgi:hypothetical protein